MKPLAKDQVKLGFIGLGNMGSRQELQDTQSKALTR
jgi:hypothetical protein